MPGKQLALAAFMVALCAVAARAEDDYSRSGWYATTALAFQRHLRGGAAGIAPPWANFAPLLADINALRLTPAQQAHHVAAQHRRFLRVYRRMGYNAHLARAAARLSLMADERPDAMAVAMPLGRDSQGRRQYAQMTFRQLDQDSSRIAAGLGQMGRFLRRAPGRD